MNVPSSQRCVNLDWLEVHCFEPSNDPHDANYFRRAGLEVVEREYGTRVYKEMFTISDRRGNPFVEVRRNPYSQGFQGVHAAEECHLRLVNAACYYDDAALRLQNFMDIYGYTLNRISRVDICLDFEKFDEGDDPAKFLSRYLRQVYSKINQGNITAHGTDRWDGQIWNSVSWGSPSSAIGTKFYNKTQELYDPTSGTFKKPHIRYAWLQCGLIDDFHKVLKKNKDGWYQPQIWRIEFSIRSSVKKWFTIELNGIERNYQSIRNTLEMYDCREKLVTLFAALQQHYFHFKYLEYKDNRLSKSATRTALSTIAVDRNTKLGKYVAEKERLRKDRCRDKVLFNWKGLQRTYKVGRDDIASILGDGAKKAKPYDTLLRKLREFRQGQVKHDVLNACDIIIKVLEGDILRSDVRNPFNWQELLVLQQTLSRKAEGDTTDAAVLMNEIKELLHLNDKTAIF